MIRIVCPPSHELGPAMIDGSRNLICPARSSVLVADRERHYHRLAEHDSALAHA